MLVKLGVVHRRELVGTVDTSQQPGQETGLQLLLLHKPLCHCQWRGKYRINGSEYEYYGRENDKETVEGIVE